MITGSATLHHRLIAAGLGWIASLIVSLAPGEARAQAVAWPTFGPDQQLLRLDGFTDALPDFVGPIDAAPSSRSSPKATTIRSLLPLVFDAFPTCAGAAAHVAWIPPDPRVTLHTQRLDPSTITPANRGRLCGSTRRVREKQPVGRAHGIFPNLIMTGSGAATASLAAGRESSGAAKVIFATSPRPRAPRPERTSPR